MAELPPIVSRFATTEEAEAYDRSLRAKVPANIEDSRPSILHEEVTVRLQAKIDRAKRRSGFMAGQIKVPEDFDTTGAAEIEALFEARDCQHLVIGGQRSWPS